VTARLSSTYFNDPGRNTIFMWTLLLLGGQYDVPLCSYVVAIACLYC
jgi:hypothetical protein